MSPKVSKGLIKAQISSPRLKRAYQCSLYGLSRANFCLSKKRPLKFLGLKRVHWKVYGANSLKTSKLTKAQIIFKAKMSPAKFYGPMKFLGLKKNRKVYGPEDIFGAHKRSLGLKRASWCSKGLTGSQTCLRAKISLAKFYGSKGAHLLKKSEPCLVYKTKSSYTLLDICVDYQSLFL